MVQQAQAAVFAAQGKVTTAELNLSYTTFYSPLTGLSSFSKKHEGSYLSAGANGLLTYVAQLDPIWVNFSVSENQMLKYRREIEHGLLKFPTLNLFEVAITLADGSVYPHLGRINFSEPSFSQETGTFLVRTLFANPEGDLRPGQFVRVQLRGAMRPNSILLPQRAVLQGAKGHYVWVVDGEGKAARREVEIGDWQGDGWFINHGLLPGERVVVDGAIRLSPGAILKVVDASAPMSAATGIESVIYTFFEALALVVAVVFLFLQNLRATISPIIAVPISVVGAAMGMIALGFSLNMLTMFGMILTIGIAVDNAIVVVEAVEHNMSRFGLSARDAAKKAMDEVGGALIAIVLVLLSRWRLFQASQGSYTSSSPSRLQFQSRYPAWWH